MKNKGSNRDLKHAISDYNLIPVHTLELKPSGDIQTLQEDANLFQNPSMQSIERNTSLKELVTDALVEVPSVTEVQVVNQCEEVVLTSNQIEEMLNVQSVSRYKQFMFTAKTLKSSSVIFDSLNPKIKVKRSPQARKRIVQTLKSSKIQIDDDQYTPIAIQSYKTKPVVIKNVKNRTLDYIAQNSKGCQNEEEITIQQSEPKLKQSSILSLSGQHIDLPEKPQQVIILQEKTKIDLPQTQPKSKAISSEAVSPRQTLQTSGNLSISLSSQSLKSPNKPRVIQVKNTGNSTSLQSLKLDQELQKSEQETKSLIKIEINSEPTSRLSIGAKSLSQLKPFSIQRIGIKKYLNQNLNNLQVIQEYHNKVIHDENQESSQRSNQKSISPTSHKPKISVEFKYQQRSLEQQLSEDIFQMENQYVSRQQIQTVVSPSQERLLTVCASNQYPIILKVSHKNPEIDQYLQAKSLLKKQLPQPSPRQSMLQKIEKILQSDNNKDISNTLTIQAKIKPTNQKIQDTTRAMMSMSRLLEDKRQNIASRKSFQDEKVDRGFGVQESLTDCVVQFQNNFQSTFQHILSNDKLYTPQSNSKIELVKQLSQTARNPVVSKKNLDQDSVEKQSQSVFLSQMKSDFVVPIQSSTRSTKKTPLHRLLDFEQMEEFNRLLGIRPDKSKVVKQVQKQQDYSRNRIQPCFDLVATHQASAIPFQAAYTERNYRQRSMVSYGAMLVKSDQLLNEGIKSNQKKQKNQQRYLVFNELR